MNCIITIKISAQNTHYKQVHTVNMHLLPLHQDGASKMLCILQEQKRHRDWMILNDLPEIFQIHNPFLIPLHTNLQIIKKCRMSEYNLKLLLIENFNTHKHTCFT